MKKVALACILSSLSSIAIFASPRTANAAQPCSARPLTVSPISTADLRYIYPLGNLNPPDHTLPADHVYFYVPLDTNGQPIPKTIRAPGNLTVTSISATFYYTGSTKTGADYSILFSVCPSVTGKFGHVAALSSALKAQVKKWDRCTTYQSGTPGKTYRACSRTMSHALRAGQSMGKAGGPISGAFDLWMYDVRAKTPSFANPLRYPNKQLFTTVCPLDYFRLSLQTQLKPYFGDGQTARTVSPICGSFAQDKVSTLQGNWFYGKSTLDNSQGWTKELALVHDPRDGILGAISYGGVIGTPSFWNFMPAHEGIINREFKEVTPSNTVYCYHDGDNASHHSTFHNGRILIQLISSKTLKIEYQDSLTCFDVVAFQAPKIFRR